MWNDTCAMTRHATSKRLLKGRFSTASVLIMPRRRKLRKKCDYMSRNKHGDRKDGRRETLSMRKVGGVLDSKVKSGQG